mgnify:CR=1 FL=1
MYCVRNRSISSSPPKSKVGKGALNSAVVYSSSTMMALAFCDACEMKKIPLQSWCSSQEDLAAHALLEEMNLESSQGVGRERRRLNDDNTLAPKKDHRQPQLILRKLTVLDPTHLLQKQIPQNSMFHQEQMQFQLWLSFRKCRWRGSFCLFSWHYTELSQEPNLLLQPRRDLHKERKLLYPLRFVMWSWPKPLSLLQSN